MRYAKSKEDKLEKRKALLDEVQRQFVDKTFEAIRIMDVASGAGVSKGTVFNYFESKETLFMVLLIREYGRWFDGMYQLIQQRESMTDGDLIRIVIKYVDTTVVDDERLFALIGLGHSHLEHNVSLRMAERYRSFINDKVTKLGFLIASKIPSVSQVQGIKLVMTLHTLFVGHVQMATMPSIMETTLSLDELEAYDIDFRVTILESIKVYMNGLLSR